jgi:hypothetical protein
MQYYLCPRCKFKIAANKHVCTTCGLNVSAYNSTVGGEQTDKDAKPAKSNVWARMMRLDSRPSKESGQEKPALG